MSVNVMMEIKWTDVKLTSLRSHYISYTSRLNGLSLVHTMLKFCSVFPLSVSQSELFMDRISDRCVSSPKWRKFYTIWPVEVNADDKAHVPWLYLAAALSSLRGSCVSVACSRRISVILWCWSECLQLSHAEKVFVDATDARRPRLPRRQHCIG